jgi:hypothetical protein
MELLVGTVGAKFTQNQFLVLPPRLAVTIINRPQILPPPLVSQLDLPQTGFSLGYILYGATLSPSVTF